MRTTRLAILCTANVKQLVLLARNERPTGAAHVGRAVARILLAALPPCVAVSISAIVLPRIAAGCPFCSAPSLTLTEQIDQTDAVALARWVSGQKSVDDKPGHTTFEVLEVVKLPPATAESGDSARTPAAKKPDGPGKSLKKGDRVALAQYRAGKKDDLFLLTGLLGAAIEWGSPLEMTRARFSYISQAPSPELPTQKRLPYFIEFLESPDEIIAADAFAEFANAPYKDIAPLAEIFPRERIRKWIFDSETPQARLGLYGMLLGLCGTPEDARLLEKKIIEPTTDYRLGLDGIMGGYLLLTGEKGLNVIDTTKLRNTFAVDRDGKFLLDENGRKTAIPGSEVYAARAAMDFMWTNGDGRISKDRLRRSMRILLGRPELADLVIKDLARWKDWSVQDRLMGLYGAKDYNISSVKRAIVGYMLVSIRDKPAGESVEDPPHVAKGKEYLAALQKKDPKTVRETKRFLFFP